MPALQRGVSRPSACNARAHQNVIGEKAWPASAVVVVVFRGRQNIRAHRHAVVARPSRAEKKQNDEHLARRRGARCADVPGDNGRARRTVAEIIT